MVSSRHPDGQHSDWVNQGRYAELLLGKGETAGTETFKLRQMAMCALMHTDRYTAKHGCCAAQPHQYIAASVGQHALRPRDSGVVATGPHIAGPSTAEGSKQVRGDGLLQVMDLAEFLVAVTVQDNLISQLAINRVLSWQMLRQIKPG